MVEENRVLVTVETHLDKLTIETCQDNGVEDWKAIFITILTFLAFHATTITELFPEEKE